MKSKQKPKIYFGLRLHPGWANKQATQGMTAIVRATGIPKVYSPVVAWFAERLIFVGVIIAAIAFSGGILFNIYISAPLADSGAYDVIVAKAEVAKEQIIDISSSIFSNLIVENHLSKLDNKASAIVEREVQIKQYLASKGSPIADDKAAIIALATAKNMKLIVAISFVESDFGKHCYYYNCSGIGGPSLRKYASYSAWISDFDNLLESRYKGLPPEKFVGLYVQPGSPNWINGVEQVLNEFDKLGIS